MALTLFFLIKEVKILRSKPSNPMTKIFFMLFPMIVSILSEQINHVLLKVTFYKQSLQKKIGAPNLLTQHLLICLARFMSIQDFSRPTLFNISWTFLISRRRPYYFSLDVSTSQVTKMKCCPGHCKGTGRYRYISL